MPKCRDCMPILKQENEIPFNLFLLLRDQCIMAEGNPVALILSTARAEIAAILKDKQDQDICLNRILSAHRNMLKIIYEKKEEALGKNR